MNYTDIKEQLENLRDYNEALKLENKFLWSLLTQEQKDKAAQKYKELPF